MFRDHVIETDRHKIKYRRNFANILAVDIMAIRYDIRAKSSIFRVSCYFNQVSARERFTPGEDEGSGANLDRLINQILALRRG
jgi:hypothetical protein